MCSERVVACEPCIAKNYSVGEHATGACIGTHYPQLPCDSRLRLRRRGYIGPAELPLCAALFRGGSISRLPPPTEIQNGLASGTTYRAAKTLAKMALALNITGIKARLGE
jgi:hypothetical protein